MSGRDRKPADKTSTSTYESRTTTYTSDVGGGSVYRPMMAPRNIIIQRTSVGGMSPGMGGRGFSSERSVHYSTGYGGLPAGSYSVVTTTGVSSVKESREREKRDMQDLNERFASYIEKVRFLEAQNRKLADELEKLKAGWGKETSAIKAMYEAELDQARKLLDDGQKDNARLEIRVTSLEEQLEEARRSLDDARRSAQEEREKVERQNQQLSDYEAEINLLRRRLENLETDREKDKKQIAQLTESLNRARMDLDNETLLHIDAENRRQTLEEQMEFMKTVHEQEMKELAALVYRDTTSENREFWKNEMGQALREIQQVYDDKIDNIRGEMESFYNMKLQEFRTGAARQNLESNHVREETKRWKTQMAEFHDKSNELESRNAQLMRELESLRREKETREREYESENGELRNELVKLRAELEAVLREVQNLMDTKLGLELEISAYRKLLESEENRISYSSDRGFSDTKSIGGGGGGSSYGGGATAGGSTRGDTSGRGGDTSGRGGDISGRGGDTSGRGGDSYGRGDTSGRGGDSYGRDGRGGDTSGRGGDTSGRGGDSYGRDGRGGDPYGRSGGGSSRPGGASESRITSRSESRLRSSAPGEDDEEVTMSQSSPGSMLSKGEMSAKTSLQRSAKGPITIAECGNDGKFMILENTGRKEENVSGWKIKRIVDDRDAAEFALPDRFILEPNSKIKIWAKGAKPSGAPASDFESKESNWGVGPNIVTKLINPAGDERATHIQKTVYV